MSTQGQNIVLPGMQGNVINKTLLNPTLSAPNPLNMNPLNQGFASNGVASTGAIGNGVGVVGGIGQTTGGGFTATQSFSSFQQSSISSASVESVAQSLGAALNEVPWMQFQVIAQPNMSLFMSDARLQAFIQSITQVTVASVTEEIVQQFNQTIQLLIAGINQTVSTRMASVTQNVLQQITSLSGSGGATAFQTLGATSTGGIATGVAVSSTAMGMSSSSSMSASTGSVTTGSFGFGGASVGGGIGGDATIGGPVPFIPLPSILPLPVGRPHRKKHRFDCPNKEDEGSCNCPEDTDDDKPRKKHRSECPNKDDRGTCGCSEDGGDKKTHKKHKPSCRNKDDRGTCDCPGDDDDNCPILFPNQKPINIPPPDLGNGTWIWTKEVIAGGGKVPRCARPFRKVITTKCPVNRLTVDVTCDNAYTIYVNGKLVGSGMNWAAAQRYTVTFENTNKVVVAVYAAQDTEQVGLICAGLVWNSQEKSPQGIPFITDATWKTVAANDFDMNFFREGFDDSNWENAVVQYPYGGGVWGAVAKPNANSVKGSPPPILGALTIPPAIPGVPRAPKAENAKVISLNDDSK
ncbi:hypothetical protein CPB84DRAFT_1788913 [Gymnopilus junonius]|uniref:Uncharacterized protein n=1 Tax=Gymnopilus junonius TaxID=109634 RepID=A0A9P5NG68_GYMJU|nr:hypothetical protein CPB84DRAFT_1788913 [Gymnopilus junonius]